jgi:hypothetical protein
MIVVLAEFGGERLLGKVREIADSLGSRVLAIASFSNATEEYCHRLISLGADEVIRYDDPSNVFEWVEVLASLLKADTRIRFVFVAAGSYSDAILGRVYALSKDRVGAFATGIDSTNDNEMTKDLRSWEVSLHYRLDPEKVSLLSFKSTAIPMPFEDATRYGKISELKTPVLKSLKDSPSTVSLKRDESLDSSGILTVLVGKSWGNDEVKLKVAQRVAAKYRGKVVKQSSKIEEVYGPCLAIEVEGFQERELPSFQGELIAINSSETQIISRIADTVGLTKDIPKVMEKL